MFADLNRYAIRPSKSISVLYDHRDEFASVTRLVVAQTPVFRDLTDFESNNLSARSRNLFTLSGLHSATASLLEGVDEGEPAKMVERASQFWKLVAEQFPQWQQVQRSEITAGEIRKDFIHTHAVVLHALGIVGNILLAEVPEDEWADILGRLQTIDWRRNATATWEGKAMTGGRVAKNRANLQLTSEYIAEVLGFNQTSRDWRIGAPA